MVIKNLKRVEMKMTKEKE